MNAVRVRRPGRQRGAAALFAIVMLCFAMVLVAALAQRNVVVEERRSANELRSRIAFAAADAGLEWAIARVNDPAPIGATCLPSTDAAATSFRSRMLRIDGASGAVTPTTWNDGVASVPLQAACVRGAAAWTCSCPASGRPAFPAIDGSELAPAFFVELAASPRPGVVRVAATGCTKTAVASGCAPIDATGREATAHVEIAWALLPALRSAPAAALTVGGDIDIGAAALGVANADVASGGLAVHAGGRVVASALRIDAPPGASLGDSIAAGDDELRALGSDRLFARHFGMTPRIWAAQPAARRLACSDDCATAIAAAIARGARLLFVDGDAAIAGPVVLGSADDPIALVAGGALTIVGDVALHGVVHAASLDWRDGRAGFAFVHGAVVVTGDVRGNAAADIVRDATALDRLANASGSFVRVNGSWKDF
jgi:Tfp pilus assembly protein PilX